MDGMISRITIILRNSPSSKQNLVEINRDIELWGITW